MKSLSEIQKEQAEWSDRNFGPQSPERMIFGMMEELGELTSAHGTTDAINDYLFECICWLGKLCHYRLKKLQNIRHEDDETDKKAKRLAHQLSVVADGVSGLWSYHNLECPYVQIAVATEEESEKIRKDSYADLMIFGLGYVTAAGLGDAEEILNEVWDEVSKRDWTKYKKDGVSE